MKIILASHGSLADAMLKVLHMILGNEDDVESYCLDNYENPVALSEAVKKKIEAEAGKQAILVCDIRGGSIFNHLLPLCVNPGISIFTGMNLNLVLHLVNIKPKTEDEIKEVIMEAKAGVDYFDSEILEKMINENDADSL